MTRRLGRGRVKRRWIVASACLVAAVSAAASPGPAQSRARIGPERVIVVAPGGGRVVIARHPFRLRFVDARGRTVLREVRNRRLRARRLPETLDPEPFAVERKPDNATYAPLSFEIGRDRHDQWSAGLWVGNMLFSRRSGRVHFARGVISARRIGDGVRLLVATTLRRRKLIVVIRPDARGSIRVRIRPSRRKGVISVADSFVARPGEGFHGFGGRHGTTDKLGEKLWGWTDQENLGGEPTLSTGQFLFPFLVEQWSDYTVDELGGTPAIPDDLPGGYERYMAPNGPNAAYYPQAQLVSSRGFGFLLNESRLSRWRMGNDRPGAWQVQVAGRGLDYTVVFGPGPARAMRRLTAITGRHRLPPRWAQRPTLSRAIQTPALPGQPAPENASTYKAKVEADLAAIETLDLEIGAYAFEGWALLRDNDYVRDVIKRLHAQGIKAILYHRAYVSDDALGTQPPGDYQETKKKGLVAKTKGGRPYIFTGNGFADSTLLDYTNPRTVAWWRKRLLFTLSLGMDGFMQDFGEQVQEDMHFHDGTTGVTMHNRYPVIFHRVSRRILDRWSRRHPKRGPVWFFTRAGYSGRPGAAAWEMSNFPGDETVDWSAGSGLRSLAPDMLNRAVGGAFGFNTDIGGYADFLTGPTSEELFNRWSEWAALTPYFRVHNDAANGTRMPWAYGPATLERWEQMAALHDRATTLMRRLWRKGRRTGMPITRPMWLAAPEAPDFGNDQQWLLGPNVLVAPVVVEGATARQVAFPRGCWRHQETGQSFTGPGSGTVPAALGELPYFFRCGTSPF